MAGGTSGIQNKVVTGAVHQGQTEAIAQPRIKLTHAEEFRAAAERVLGGRIGTATAGYTAAPKGTPYAQNTATFLHAYLQEMKGRSGLVTSPTATPDSIDALSTLAAQAHDVPAAFVTAESYLKYINTDEFPKAEDGTSLIDLERFNSAPVHYFEDKAAYSAATAQGSDALLVTGGRDTTVSDFMHAIEKGNPVVILNDPAVVTRDEHGNIQDFDGERINNASRFLSEMIGKLARKEPLESMTELPGADFDRQWIADNLDRLLTHVLVVDGSNPAEAGARAAQFISRATNPTLSWRPELWHQAPAAKPGLPKLDTEWDAAPRSTGWGGKDALHDYLSDSQEKEAL